MRKCKFKRPPRPKCL